MRRDKMGTILRRLSRSDIQVSLSSQLLSTHRLGFWLLLPKWFGYIYAMILLQPLSPSFLIAGTINACEYQYVSIQVLGSSIPRPSPNSLNVSLSGRLKRFRNSSLVGHLPSSGWRFGVPNIWAPVYAATPNTTPKARPLPRNAGKVLPGFFC